MRAFLSHSSADKPLATAIYRSLRNQAVSIWFDRLELRPGDSLLKGIADGIGNSDCLLVLVTETSNQSRWVEKEVGIALTQEVEGKGPRVIPIVVNGCSVPTMLADKIYVSVDQDGNGSQEIVPAVFRDSYILDIALTPDTLECDERGLREELYEFTRGKFETLRVRIENRNFNRKVIEIVTRSGSLPEMPGPVAAQVKRASKSYDLELPLYWANLAELLGRSLSSVFVEYGKNLDAVDVATTMAARTILLAQFVLASHINTAVFPMHAEQFGYHDIAAYIRRHESCQWHEDEEKLIRQVCEIAADQQLTEVGLEGLRDRKVIDHTVFVPVAGKDIPLLQMTCPPQDIITRYAWYCFYLPQILRRSLAWTAFREGKPLYELGYAIGLSLEDYERIGLA